MKTSELIAAILTYPNDAEWELFSDFGPQQRPFNQAALQRGSKTCLAFVSKS